MATVTGAELVGLLTQARREAQQRQQRASTAHTLLVMLRAPGMVGELLALAGVREPSLLSALKVVEEPSSSVEVAVEKALLLAQKLGARETTALHLLYTLTSTPRCSAFRALEEIGCNVARVHETVRQELGLVAPPERAPESTRPPARLTPMQPARLLPVQHTPSGQSLEPRARVARPVQPQNARRPAPRPEPVAPVTPFELDADTFLLLTQLGRNLSALAAAGRIDPVLGRDAEIEKLLDVLSRRRANNPILVGPPGVGKTAVVEGLALRLVDEARRDPESPLARTVLLEVSAGALVSGTGVRGALADKLARLRAEVTRSEGRVLLFLDEIHAIVSGQDGPDDLASELKAALARGELPCIGATTDAEYRRAFDKDAALARRFSRIDIGEPTPAQALEILRGIAPQYGRHHGVRYEDDALSAAVEMSVRYLAEKQLPDKAIGLLDLAGARTRRRGGTVVEVAHVAQVVSEQAHVPLERLLLRDAERLLAIESFLETRVVGQGACLARIGDALRKGAAGFRGNRPLGTFLLLGPTGVGKTETAKAIADLLFPERTSGAMTRLDMSEYAESHAIARLLGAPPGYVGHDEGGQLTEAVRRRPYQVVLLDEIEKAHRDVLLALLPLLDEGRLTDGRGRTVDFTNTVVVMTSNLGVDAPRTSARIGFGAAAEGPDAPHDALAAARRALPPELWNRIDEPLWFRALDRRDVGLIAARMLDHVAAQLRAEHRIELEVAPSVIDALIAAGGFDAELGARPMRRTVGRLVESLLASAVLSGSVRRGERVRLVGDGARVRVEAELRVDAAE